MDHIKCSTKGLPRSQSWWDWGGGHHRHRGIKSKSAACNTSILPTMISHWPLINYFFKELRFYHLSISSYLRAFCGKIAIKTTRITLKTVLIARLKTHILIVAKGWNSQCSNLRHKRSRQWTTKCRNFRWPFIKVRAVLTKIHLCATKLNISKLVKPSLFWWNETENKEKSKTGIFEAI